MGEPRAGRARLSAGHDDAWSALHHGIDPRSLPLLHPWLRLMWALARPLRHLPPLAATVAGAGCAVGAVVSGIPWLALALVLAAVVCDGLDGAIAVVSGRSSPAGAVADRLADRVSDTAFALVLWRLGAPLWLALAAAGMSLLLEAVREVRGGALRSRITVAERPSRAVCTVLGCVSAAVSTATWPPMVCATVWTVLGGVGLVQLIRTPVVAPSSAAGRSGATGAIGRPVPRTR